MAKANRRAAIPVALLTGLLGMALPGTAAAQLFAPISNQEGFTVYVGEQFTRPLSTLNAWPVPIRNSDVSVEWDDRSGNSGLNTTCVEVNMGLGSVFSCTISGSHTYRSAGVYVVELTYGAFQWRFPIQVLDPPGPRPDPLEQFVLVSVGDSVASGEGAPTQPSPGCCGEKSRPTWDDGLGPSYAGPLGEAAPAFPDESSCHRSQWAHGWQLLRRLEAENPGTNFSMMHQACTGAGTSEVRTQLFMVREQLDMTGGNVDALLISVGANDRVGFDNSFGDSVAKCIGPFSNCDVDKGLTIGLRYKFEFENMQPRYEAIADAITAIKKGRQSASGEPHRVEQTYITEYFDPTRDQWGQFGGPFGCSFDLITENEWSFLNREEMQPLNRNVAEAASRHGWTFVGGIANRFVNHGFCSPDSTRFVANFWDSVNGQNDRQGTAHPNRTGQWVIGDQIYEHLLQNQPPRTSAVAVADGAPYSFGTWTTDEVKIELRGRNLRGAGASKLFWRLRDLQSGTIVREELVEAEDTQAPEGARPPLASNTLHQPPYGLPMWLLSGESLWSNDGRFRLTFQNDGNLVLYYANEPLWASNTMGKAEKGIVGIEDGNLAVYDNTLKNAVWSSNTKGNGRGSLVVQNDGNVVLYKPGGNPDGSAKALWATGTMRRFTTLSQELTLNTDGVYDVTFQSANSRAVWEDERVVRVAIDRTPPVTTADVSPNSNAGDWHNTDVTVTLNATDNANGVGELSYTLSGAQTGGGVLREREDDDFIIVNWRVRVLVTQEGITTLTYFSTDKLGNRESVGTVIIKIDKTAPEIALVSRLPAANAAGWNREDITVTWSCGDGLSGPTATTVTNTLSQNGADRSLQGTCADLAGNTAGHTVSGLKLDKVPPRIVPGPFTFPAANAAGWNNQDMLVFWSCGDQLFLSGIFPDGSLFGSVRKTFSTEGANQSLEGTCEDLAGNAASNTITGLNLDKTPPSVTFGGPSPAPNAAGWNNTPVSIPFNVNDALSGIASTSIPSPLVLAADGAAVTGTVTVADAAGNTVTVESPAARIDATPPAIALVSRLPQANAAGWNRADITATWSCSDALSGPAAKEVSKTLETEGQHQSLTGMCADAAGNETKQTVSGLSLDKTPPSVTFGGPSPGPNAAGWNNTAVSIPFMATDNLSGVASTSIPSPLSLTSEGAAVIGTIDATDAAGNTTTGVSPAVKIDLTPPTIACAGTPSILWPPNQQLEAVSVSVNLIDALSGPRVFTLGSIAVNERAAPEDVTGFVVGTASTTGELRATRAGNGSGRTYALGYSGGDVAGNQATCTVPIQVPHSPGK